MKAYVDQHGNFIVEEARPGSIVDSIAAWEARVENWDKIKVHYFATNCPLCRKYVSNGCEGCPIAMDGHPTCMDTPYDKLEFDHENTGMWIVEYGKREIEYLKDLLERYPDHG